jgi:hypothetical protein
MNRGYRFSSSVALANYYADVRNTAEFGLGSFLGGLGRQANIKAQRAGNWMAEKGLRQGTMQEANKKAFSTGRQSFIDEAEKTGRFLDNPMGAAMGGRYAGQEAAQKAVRNRRNLNYGLGYGAAGVGALGLAGAGLAGYRALNPDQE